MTKPERVICAVLVGQARTDQIASDVADCFRPCPYSAAYVAAGRVVVGVLALPSTKRWWAELPREHPKLLGLERVKVFIADDVKASSPWSEGKVSPNLQLSPCGTDCQTCPWYGARCEGCPATIHFKPAE